ncbi:hypothetical protein M6D81_13295 [Paenibacillus sp. J5C_2022]|nr:hypothetical protein [Paenibacillus sp. J5C2022]
MNPRLEREKRQVRQLQAIPHSPQQPNTAVSRLGANAMYGRSIR